MSYLSFSIGDQVAREIKCAFGPLDRSLPKLDHHGIYVGGANRKVIEFNSSSQIQGVTLDMFKGDQPLYRVCYSRNPKPLEREEVVRNALEACADANGFDIYNEGSNNCDNFATCCKCGERYSQCIQNSREVSPPHSLTTVSQFSRLV